MRIKNLKTLIYPQNQGFSTKPIVFILAIILFSSCDRNIKIDDFSSKDWKRDFKACGNYRIENAQKVVDATERMIGKHENTVTQLLGHPTRLDLGKKMTRSSFYAIKNDKCDDNAGEIFLVIDYNSLSQVKLVMIQKK